MYQSRNIVRNIVRHLFFRINHHNRALLSTTSVIKNESSIQEQVKYTNIVKFHKKEPKRDPLVKNFFVGKIDKDLLAYQEVLVDENLENLYKNSESYRNLLELDEKPNTDNLDNLKNFGSFGLDVSQNYNGRGYICTETLYSNEVESKCLSLANLLSHHRLITQLLEEYGNEAQKLRFLPKLAKGEFVGTIGFMEQESPPAKKAFNVQAKFNDSNRVWTINGEKLFVLKPGVSSLFIVFASTETVDKIGDFKNTVTAFLVEGSSPGIKIQEVQKSFGLTDVKQCRVSFENVEVPETNIIGRIDSGYEIGHKFLKLSRMNSGLLSLGISKKMLNNFINHCIETKVQDVPLMEMDFAKERLGKLASEIYALESMLYMTAGLIDNYENQDTEIESAIVKNFAMDVIRRNATVPLETIGAISLLEGEKTREFLMDAFHIATQGETLDSLKLFVGLSGFQYAGVTLGEEIKKTRNPLFNPGFIFSKVLKPDPMKNPKQTHNLQFNLHPSCDAPAQWLEFSIKRLENGTELLLARHGPEIINFKIEILRVSEVATLCYAMFAAVSRASRAYCIGLKNAESEMLLAGSFCLDASERIKLIVHDIQKGEFLTNDNHYKKIGKQLLKSKEYFPEHPITRNF